MDPYNSLVDFIDMFSPVPLKAYQRKIVEAMDNRKAFKKLYEERVKVKSDCDFFQPFELAPLPVAVPVPEYTKAIWGISNIKEEGKTLMRYNDNYASASASIASPKSDAATQRDFLLEELARADYPKQKELQKVFNLFVDNTPKTYKEMIDIIKAGKYTIDPKIAKKVDAFDTSDDGNDLNDYHYGPTHGIVWPGPIADWDGYHAAEVEKTKQHAVAKRVIMTGDAAAGLKALQDFEAWLPTSQSAN